MAEVVYRSQVLLTERHGSDRTLVLPAGEQVVVGTHGALAEHYGRTPGTFEQHSATLDLVVAAALG